jgi:HlyD family secretion protein
MVEEGDAVQAGQTIALVDSEKTFLQNKQLLAGMQELRQNRLSAQRSAALAREQYENTDKKYQRLKSLLAEGSSTQQQYDDVELALKAAQTQHENARTMLMALDAKEAQLSAQLELIGSQLKDYRVIAPITGTVIDKYVESGEIARPGGPVVNLADLTRMWIKIYLKETDLARIRLNGGAELRVTAYPQQIFPGRIAQIADKAEFTPKNVQTREARADLVYAVKIMVDNPEGILKIGMPADVILL